ncbi:MAG: monovalent cation/H(+) antiporter subunit G [Phycisphaerales bacterium]
MPEIVRFILVDALLIAGAFFVLVAGVGLVRMPDLLLRMQGAAKAGTLGVGLIVLAVAVAYGTVGVFTRAVLLIGFYFITAPVAGHIISRAAYRSGIGLWDRMVCDDFRAAVEAEGFERASDEVMDAE